MSARQPFVPQQRPPSRQNLPNASSVQNTALDDSFKPNGLLSDLTNGVNEQQLSSNAQHRNNNANSDLASLVIKPLNLSGFAKKKPHNVALPFSKPRKSFDDDSTRSTSPRPRSNLPPMRIAAPSPFFASNPGFVPAPASRRTQVSSPSPITLHSSSSADEFSSNQAHIPTKPPGLDILDTSDLNKMSQSNLTSHVRVRSSSRPSLEKIHEVTEEEDAGEQYGGRGTHRDSREDADMYRSSSSPIPDEHHPAQVDASYAQGPALDREGNDKPPLRRVQKRFARPDEFEETTDYGNPTKKFKSDLVDDQQTAYYGNAIRSAPQYNLNHQEQAFGHGAFRPQVRATSAEQIPHTPIQSSLSVYPCAVQESANENLREDHGLQRLFGQDLDAYIDTHADTYEQAKKKWAECDTEEWKAGADELMNKFIKLIDFVKDHMSAKLALYVKLDQTLASHRTVLSERADTLKAAQEALVRDGGNVISGKPAISAGLGSSGGFTAMLGLQAQAKTQAQGSTVTVPNDAT